MAFGKIRSKGQITLPTEVRRAARLEEGAVVEFVVKDDGVLIQPKVLVNAEDAWFWSPAWQKGEREASEQLDAGEGQVYESGDDFLAALDPDG